MLSGAWQKNWQAAAAGGGGAGTGTGTGTWKGTGTEKPHSHTHLPWRMITIILSVCLIFSAPSWQVCVSLFLALQLSHSLSVSVCACAWLPSLAGAAALTLTRLTPKNSLFLSLFHYTKLFNFLQRLCAIWWATVSRLRAAGVGWGGVLSVSTSTSSVASWRWGTPCARRRRRLPASRQIYDV